VPDSTCEKRFGAVRLAGQNQFQFFGTQIQNIISFKFLTFGCWLMHENLTIAQNNLLCPTHGGCCSRLSPPGSYACAKS